MCIVFFLVASTFASAGSCPVWLDEYEAYHKTMRGSPDAKYLVHEVTGLAGGLGDRLRGMLFAVRVAHSLNRVILFKWNHPFAVDKFFAPASTINWQLQGISYEPGKIVRFIDGESSEVKSGSLSHAPDKFITLQTNMFMTGDCHMCPPLTSGFSQDAACVWRRIFKPTDSIVERANHILREMYPRGKKFVAVHLRLGGLSGEGVQERGNGPLANFLDAISCARKLATMATTVEKRTPILIVTDNHELRQFLQARQIPSLLTPPSLPVHLDVAKQRPLEEHQSTIVDMALLARSECLVIMRSGFGHHAWLYGGGKQCVAQLPGCQLNITSMHMSG